MKDNQSTDNFDELLRQSLEGTQMPVPAGVWETVGSSIGAKAVVATKLAGLKLVVLKSVAGLVLTGGAAFGIYELLKPDTNTEIAKTQITNNNNTEPQGITLDTIFPAEAGPSDISVSKSFIINEDSMIIYRKNESAPVFQPVIDSIVKVIDKKEPEIKEPVIKTEKPVQKDGAEKIKEPAKETPKTEPVVNPAFPEPPNVFTPDGDGLNDCFKIVVENEKVFFLQIFDDAGKKVFETADKNNCWNGKIMNIGEDCKKGVYMYKYMYELNTGFKKRFTSLLTLL